MRNHKVTVRLLTRKETPSGDLVGFLDGSVEGSAYASVKTGGRMVVRDTGQVTDWAQYRVQPVYSVGGVEYPLGVFLPSKAKDSWDDLARTWDITLADKTSILDRTQLTAFHVVPAGSNVVDAVRTLIGLSGEPAGALTPSDQTTRGTITFEPTTTLLKAINDLLTAANFFSLWCDGNGQYQVTPSTAVTARPIVAEFVDGEDGTALYSPVFSREQNIQDIPNRFTAVSSSTGDLPALIGVAENRNPDSPFSFDRLGLWVDDSEENVETTSQAAINEYAKNRLESLSGAVANIVFEHYYEPITFNNAIRFRSLPAQLDGRYTISNYSIPLNETDLMSTTAREVVDV